MIRYELLDTIGVITIERHERRNALDVDHCVALREAANQLSTGGARCIVVTGQGTSFCAGADLSGVYSQEFRTSLYSMLSTLTKLPIPVLAAVNGPAIGAGTQLAIACDLRVADHSAVFAVPTARRGLAVDPWTVRRLALLAGGGAARSMLLACEQLSADRAHMLGLVDRIGAPDMAVEWARDIATMSVKSIAYSKGALEKLFEGQRWDESLKRDFDDCWRDVGPVT
ncbi:MAG: enoyl-CoA hydratase [Acidimicrobiales bacterium]|nr:enoyl-CoA hydratase [Acidimicrobiales bacterium]